MSIIDAGARRTALDITRSFCVQAPAGSGKTELLTQRILCLLAASTKPEEVLAFTFTRKAAAEMRERLLHSLQSAAATTDAALATLPEHKRHTLALARAVLARDAELGWQLLSNSRRLRINTIDSFTQYLTAQLPLSANFGARPEISTDMERVFAQAIRQTLGWLEQGAGIAEPVAQLLAHLHGDLGRAESLLLTLLHKRDQWLPLVVQIRQQPEAARALLEANLRDMLDEALQKAHARLLPLQRQIMTLVNFASTNLAAQDDMRLSQWNFTASLPAPDAARSGAWRALATLFLKSDHKDFLGSPNVRHGFPSEKERKPLCDEMKALFKEVVAHFEDEDLLPMLQHLAMLPAPNYSDSQWDILAILTAILPQLAAELDVAMRHAGQIDHTQTSLAALQALGTDDEPTDLALRLDYSIRHILVDEFQDTSSLQFHLLHKLTAGWQPGDGRTLFIVGDGMQSCYAFRNANVGLFLRARDEGIGPVKLESLKLAVNFRSERPVVDWVNAVFSRAFPREDDIARGGVCYAPSTARNDATTAGSGIQCRLWTYDKDDNNDAATRRELEAVEVAALCEGLQAEDPRRSIAILVRNRTHLDKIVPALREAGLRWNASEIDPLLSYPAIGDMFTLLRALLNLADTTAWFALLRMPFIGLQLAAIEQIALHAGARGGSLWTALQDFAELPLGADAQTRLQRCVPLLRAARERRQSVAPRILLEQLWVALGGPACLADTAMLPNVATFLDLVDAHTEQGDIPDLQRFETQLEKCYGSAAEPGVTLHIMTIHKAKGLEFDRVILPGLDREPQADRNELLMWKEYLDASNASRPLLAVLHAKGDDQDPLYQYLRFEAGLRNRLEVTRLLYIGVTRAAQQAFLFGFVKSGKTGLQASAGTLLDSILPALLDQPALPGLRIDALQPALPPADNAAVRHTAQNLQRLPASWQWPANLAPALTVAGTTVAPAVAVPERLAARIGELVHLGLKLLTEHGEAWFRRRTGLPFWRRALLPFTHGDDAAQRALQTVHHHLEQCFAAPEAVWLFGTAHREAACELALCDYSGGWRRDYVVDRTFIDSDGKRWIIDYKSSTPAPGQPLADFYAEQAVLYREQLQTYARLLAGHDAQAPVLALFFTGLPALHVLE